MRGWLLLSLVASGAVLTAAAGLVWWSVERALGPAPEVVTSPRGGLSLCPYEQVGQLTCDPPRLTGGTVTAVVVLGVLGVALLAAGVFGLVRRRVRSSRD